METWQNRLKKFRVEILDKSQLELSQLLEISQTTYTHYENKGKMLPANILLRLKRLGLNEEWLFSPQGKAGTAPISSDRASGDTIPHQIGSPILEPPGASGAEIDRLRARIEELIEQLGEARGGQKQAIADLDKCFDSLNRCIERLPKTRDPNQGDLFGGNKK